MHAHVPASAVPTHRESRDHGVRVPHCGCRAGTGVHLPPPRTLTFGGGPRPLRGRRGALSPESQPAAEGGPEPAQLALRTPPGTLGPGQLPLQAVDPAAGPVHASPEAVHLAGGTTQLGPQRLLGRLTLLEALLQLRLPGLSPGLRLRQRPLQPPHLRGFGGSEGGSAPGLSPQPPWDQGACPEGSREPRWPQRTPARQGHGRELPTPARGLPRDPTLCSRPREARAGSVSSRDHGWGPQGA